MRPVSKSEFQFVWYATSLGFHVDVIFSSSCNDFAFVPTRADYPLLSTFHPSARYLFTLDCSRYDCYNNEEAQFEHLKDIVLSAFSNSSIVPLSISENPERIFV